MSRLTNWLGSAGTATGTRVWTGTAADHVIGLNWSADGGRLAVVPGTGPVAVFDGPTGTQRPDIAAHSGGSLVAAYQPHGKLLATAGKDGLVRLWDADGREARALDGGATWVEHLAWHPGGAMLASAAGRTVRVWHPDGELLADLADHPSTVADIAWRPHSGTLAVAVYGGVKLWTVSAKPTAESFAWKGSPLKLAWSPDGSLLAHGNQDSTVHFWYAATGDDLQMSGYAKKIRELSWDRTSRYLATGGGPAVCLWDCGGAGPAGSTPRMLEEHELPLTAVAYQAAGPLLASAGQDGRVCVWKPFDKKRPLVFDDRIPGGEATALAWSPDDRLLAVGGESGAVAVYRIG